MRARAEDLVATNEEFLAAAWDASADAGSRAPIDLGQLRVSDSGFHTIAATQQESLDRNLSWWEITELVDSVKPSQQCSRRRHPNYDGRGTGSRRPSPAR